VTSELLADLDCQPADLRELALAENALAAGETANPPELPQMRGVLALVAAAARNDVCMQGHFRTQVAHSKAIYRMLHHQATLNRLSSDEREFVRKHVPFTAALTAADINLQEIKTNKDLWIIKPIDGYGSVGVFPGQSFSSAKWDSLIDEHSDGSYVVQRYCQQYSMFNCLNDAGLPGSVARTSDAVSSTDSIEASNDTGIMAAAGTAATAGIAAAADTANPANLANPAAGTNKKDFDCAMLAHYNVLTGLFIYNGRFTGVYTRAGTDALIVGFRGGVTLATMLANFSPDEALALGVGIRPRALSRN
jgi:hypothetical protein